jgi:hypothetical protein
MLPEPLARSLRLNNTNGGRPKLEPTKEQRNYYKFLLADGNADRSPRPSYSRQISHALTKPGSGGWGQPALSKADAILQKPYADSDLVIVIPQLVY